VAELRKVVIAGGGVGGCAVALALRRAGIAVEIHEKYGDFQGRATGFSIWAYAIKRLLEFGFECERLQRIGREMVRQDIYSQEGELTMSLPVGEVSATTGAPSMDVDRRATGSTASAPRSWAWSRTTRPRRCGSPTAGRRRATASSRPTGSTRPFATASTSVPAFRSPRPTRSRASRTSTTRGCAVHVRVLAALAPSDGPEQPHRLEVDLLTEHLDPPVDHAPLLERKALRHVDHTIEG
jgi:hypothetical protein